MTKIIGINKYLIKNPPKKMIIHWLITDFCNYKCEYCLATERFLKKIVSKSELDRFIKSLKKLNKENNYEEIEVQLSGGEPMSNPIFFEIIKELSKIENVKITVITNASLIVNLEEKMKDISKVNKDIDFLCSWHKIETSLENFSNNLEILKKYCFPYKVVFLIPRDISLKTLKENIEKISNEHKNADKMFRLIIEGNEISKKYKKEIIDFYNEYTSNNFDSLRYEEKFIIDYDNNIQIILEGRKQVNDLFFVNSDNRKYKGWTCYNYINNYHIVRPDGVWLYGGCDIFRNTNLEANFYENPSIINKAVVCSKDVCRCDSNMPTPKIFNLKNTIKIKKIDNILLKIKNSINKLLKNNEIYIDKIRIIDNRVSNITLKVNFYLNESYVICAIEKFNASTKYDFISQNYGVKFKRIDNTNKFEQNKSFILKNIILIIKLIEKNNINI